MKDPKQRIGTKDANDETWLQFGNNKQAFGNNFYNSLSNFVGRLKFLKALLRYLQTFDSTFHIKEELEEIYTRKDLDHDFKISHEEIIQGYITVFDGNENASSESKVLLSKMETVDPLVADYRLYIRLVLVNVREQIKEEIKVAYDLYDEDHDGYIPKSCLLSIIDITDSETHLCVALKECLNSNTDDSISKELFLTLLSTKV